MPRRANRPAKRLGGALPKAPNPRVDPVVSAERFVPGGFQTQPCPVCADGTLMVVGERQRKAIRWYVGDLGDKAEISITRVGGVCTSCDPEGAALLIECIEYLERLNPPTHSAHDLF